MNRLYVFISLVVMLQAMVARYALTIMVGSGNGWLVDMVIALLFVLNWSVFLLAMGYFIYGSSWLIYVQVNR